MCAYRLHPWVGVDHDHGGGESKWRALQVVVILGEKSQATPKEDKGKSRAKRHKET